jgi:type VI secretion system secreted protein VgrG
MWLRTFCLLILSFLTLPAYAGPILGTAGSFGVLGGSTVTNTGPTTINGNLGVWPGTALTNVPPLTVTGTINLGDGVAQTAQGDLTTAYNGLVGMSVTADETGKDLGTLTLTPGVYKFDSSAQLTGTLTLNAQGNNNALWVFEIGSTLTTASASSVDIINPGPTPNEGLFWQVGSSATLGTTTAFEGNIVALTAITLDTGATIACGSALARNAAVTLDDNIITTGCSGGGTITNGVVTALPYAPAPVPEPGSMALLGSGLFALAGVVRKRKPRK